MTAVPRIAARLSIVLCTVALAACASKEQRIESGLRKGAEFVQKGDWDRASVEIRNVLQIDPKNARAYLLAGRIDDGRVAVRSAFTNYTRALELDPASTDARIGLARVYLLANDLPAADKMVTQALAAEPANPRARAIRIALISRRGDPDGAVAEARRLVDGTPALPPDAAMLVAALFASAQDHATALTVLDQALAKDRANVAMLQIAAEVAGDAPAAAGLASRTPGYYRAAVEAAPRNDDLWRRWSLWHIRRSELDAAEGVLRDAIQAAPSDPGRTRALLEFMGAFRPADAAQKEFTGAVAAAPKDASIRFALADFYASQRRVSDERRTLEEIVALGRDAPSGLAARSRLAALGLAEGKVEDARATLADVLRLNPRDAEALVLRSRILLAADSNPRDAIIDLRAAARDRPGSSEIATLLAAAHRALGEPQMAREAIVDAVRLAPRDAQLHLLLAADMATAGDLRAAESEVDEAIRLRPQQMRAHEMKVELALARRDYATAEQASAGIQARFPDSPTGLLLEGRTLAQQGKADAAIQKFDAAARLAPQAAEPIVATLSVLTQQRRFAEARKRLQALADASPEAPLPHELLGELALVQGDHVTAERAFREVIRLGTAPPSTYKNLAATYVARNDLATALAVAAEGEKAHPSDPALPIARAEWLARAGRLDESAGVYETVLRRWPANDVAANNFAVVLTTKGDRASLERALAVAERFKDSASPGNLDTLAMVHYRMRRYADAAGLLQRALTLAPDEPVLRLHCGMALVKGGDAQLGKTYLRKALESRTPLPDLAEARTLVAQG
jgi:tetratricopeptide (TPR) repeat protein